MKKIIITADDYGPVSTINRGIEQALEWECINTVSVLVNGRDANDECVAHEYLSKLHRRFPEAHIGVHLSITSGQPVSDIGKVSSLVKKDGSGQFMGYDEYEYERVSLQELSSEVQAQIEMFKETGIFLDHISCHHGLLTLFPDFFKIYMDAAIQHGVPIRNPIPISRLGIHGFRRSRVKREGIIAAIKLIDDVWWTNLLGLVVHVHPGNLQHMMDVYAHGQLRYAGYFIDTYYKKSSKRRWRKILRNLPEDRESELMVHLKVNGRDEMIPNGIDTKYFKGREKELSIMKQLSPINGLLETYGVEFSGFADIP